jgi:hypothetical protein
VVLDVMDRLLVRGFQGLLAMDRWAIDVVDRVVGDRLLAAADRAVQWGRRGWWRRRVGGRP